MIEDKIILNLAEPYIKVFPIYSNPLGIILANCKDNKWLLNNFIQLASSEVALYFYDFNYKTCPFLSFERVNKDIISHLTGDILSFILESIKLKKYVYLTINTNYINAYQYDYIHDIFIYGMDQNNKILYVADNFINGKYSYNICSFDELKRSLNSLEDNDEKYNGFDGCIETLKYKQSDQNFNIMRVKDSLINYLMGIGTTQWSVMDIRVEYNREYWKFGIDCYEFLRKLIIKKYEIMVNINPFHLMWEHKSNLHRLFNYMIDNNYLEKIDLTWVEEIEKMSLVARN